MFGEQVIDPVRSAFVTAVQLLQAGRASLLLRQNSEPVLTVAAAVGIAPSAIPEISVRIGEGIAGLVAARGVSLFGSFDSAEAFLSVPIVTDQGVEGVLSVTNRLGDRTFGPADLAPTSSIARHIATLLRYSRIATRDPVSGLMNRQAFDEMLERELARSERTGAPFTLVFMDMDNLKTINDRFGHAMGDDVIRGTGAALRSVVRPYDFAGRYGGDEFVLLLSGSEDVPTEAPGGIMERIARAIDRVSQETGVEVSLSAGVAHYPQDGKSTAALLAAADARMYREKPRNRRA